MPVTEEQRVRMEQKRAEALAKVKSRQGTLSHSAASTSQNNATPNPAIRAPFAPPRDQVPLNPGIRAQFVPPRIQPKQKQLVNANPSSSSTLDFRVPPSANPSSSSTGIRVPLNANPSSLSTGSRVSLNATSSTGIRVPLNPTPNSSSAGIRVPLNPNHGSSSGGIKVSLVPSSAQQKQPQKMISNGLCLVPQNSSSFSNASNQFHPPHKPVTVSRGLTEEQKITMENKRAAALAKKQQSQTQVPKSTNTHEPNVKMNPPNVLNTQSFYKPLENPLKSLPSQNKYMTNVSQNKVQANGFTSNNNRLKGTLSLISKDRFQVQVNYHESLIKIFKSMKTGSYNAKDRIWSFHISDHDPLIQAATPLKPDLELTPLPRWILETFKRPKPEQEIDITRIEPLIYESLMPFQHEGIKYGISRNGRVLIADDMGLGKTVQALGLASYYKESWPFLIVAPSSMRFPWKAAVERWLPSIHCQDVQVILTGKDNIGSEQVTIMSYDLLSKKQAELKNKNYQLIIMDESHCLKNEKSARTKAAEPLMKSCRNLILLSGTPALSRPMELYSQITALQPKLFRWVSEFGNRYCDGKMKIIGTKEIPDYSGSSHMQELSLLLSQRCMIRRLKTEVLHQLPEKRREMVLLDPGSVDCTSKIMKDKETAAKKTNLAAMEKRGLLLEWYAATSQAKLKAVQGYVKDLALSEKKFLLFCHHRVMINGIRDMLEKEKIDFMLIDGNVSSEARKKAVDRFQTVDTCRVALLSITAANSGITLTAAHLVVFAEIYWNPGILCQAEDRTHRIGQTNSVMVQYLVAKGTADDELWPMIKRKLDVLNQAGLSKDNFENSDSRQLESKDQSRIQDFFKPEDEDEADEFDELWGSMENIDETEFEQYMPQQAKKIKLS